MKMIDLLFHVDESTPLLIKVVGDKSYNLYNGTIAEMGVEQFRIIANDYPLVKKISGLSNGILIETDKRDVNA